MVLKLPWRTWRWSMYSVWWSVACDQCVLDSWATCGWILQIGRNAEAMPVSNSTVSSHQLVSTVIRTLACRQSKNSFWRPGISIINTVSICRYMKVSFRLFKITWNMYFLNYLCYTWSHGWQLVYSSIVPFTKSLTLPNDYVLILLKLQIVLMGFPRFGAAFYTRIAHECPYSKPNDMYQAWYEVS